MADTFALSVLGVYAAQARRRLLHQTRHVMATQTHFLRGLLRAHAATELGQQFQLRTIRTLEEFRQRVPVHPYEFYAPYTDRIAQGEHHVLNPDPVTYINLTSGSTGAKKQVPVTRQFQRTLRRANLASIGCAIASLQAQGRPFGKALLTNSAQLQGYTPAGIPYGPVSVGSIRQGRGLVEQLFSSPFAAFEIDDTVARHYVCLLFALRDRTLKGWVANFPMLILRTCQLLDQYAEALIEDLQRGTLAPGFSLDASLRDRLEKRWSAAPDRAAELRTLFTQTGTLTPREAWPHLSYITTARGGTSDFYLQRFPDYFGDLPIFGGVYGTAEATFSVCPEVNADGGILAVNSGFFEFVPVEQWGESHPQTRLATELTVGDRYRILITSYSGFYRYDIGDVVEVVGYDNQAPLIVFRHRHGGLLSATTEKTTEFHVTQVMQGLQQEFGITLDDFCITLSANEFPARYVVNIELAPGQTLADPRQFLQRFDDRLSQVNTPYGTVRQSQVPPPCLRILPPASFAAIRQRQVSQGMFDSQLKIPHITEDRAFLAGIVPDAEITLGTPVSFPL